MKDYCRFGLLFCTLFLWLALDLAAQAPINGYCGTRMGRSEWLKNYQRNPGAVPRTTDTLYLPIQIHRVSDSNGEGAITISDVIEKVCTLNEQYATSNMQFVIAGISALADDQIFNHPTLTFTVGEEIRNNNVSDRINMYFVENARGACGYWSSFVDAVVLSINNSGCQLGGEDYTLSHEMGHFLTLPHTFLGWEDITELNYSEPAPATVFYSGQNIPVEKVDGSNCAIAADGFCDTSPDYLNYRWPCNGDNISEEVQLDPDSVAFQSVAAYIMGYSYDACQYLFSEEQTLAMRAYITQQRPNLIINPTPGQLALPELSELALLEPANGTNTDYFDSIQLTWTPVTAALGYQVQLNIINDFSQGTALELLSFDTTLVIEEGLVKNRRYFWRVSPIMPYEVCGSNFSSARNFRTSSLSPVSDPILSGALKVYPNPIANGTLLLELNDASLRGNLDYEFIDRLGRVVRRGKIGNFDTTRIDVSGLPQGIYFLRARADGRFTTKKIVVN